VVEKRTEDHHCESVSALEKYLSEKIAAIIDLANEREARNVERFAAQKEGVTVAMSAAEKAVAKAETAADKRFDSVNEFRGALNDLSNRMIPRSEADTRIGALSEKVDTISAWKEKMEGRGGGFKDGINWIVMGIGAALGAVVSWFLKGGH
jgi:hypothetical protein